MGLSQHRWQGLKGVSPFARRLYYTSQEFVYIVVVPIETNNNRKKTAIRHQIDINQTP